MTLDWMFGGIGIAVVLWSIAASVWTVRSSRKRESMALAAWSISAVALYRERRAQAAE